MLVPYLVETLGLTSLEEVESLGTLGAKGFEQALAAADTKDEVPEPLKSGAFEWHASLSAPTRLRPAARFAAKEKTSERFGSSRKPKTAPEARDDSDVDDDVESVAASAPRELWLGAIKLDIGELRHVVCFGSGTALVGA